MKQPIKWIKEETAANMLGYTSLLWFRRLVKERKLEVDYTRVRGCGYMYSERDLNEVLLSHSTVSR